MKTMDGDAAGEAGPVSGGSQREKKDLKMDVEDLEEPDSDSEGCSTKRLYKKIQDKLLHPCCTPEDSIDQANPSSMIERWVNSIITPPATPVTHPPFIPVPSSLPAVASTVVSSVVNPTVSSPTSSPISSMCNPTSSAWDSLGSTPRSPGCSDGDPVGAAAHLHLLGESLTLIGRHLQETDKMVSMSSSLSLLLDSLLCSLAPLLCLTAQIPELRSCTQHTLASTLENISYVMPGL